MGKTRLALEMARQFTNEHHIFINGIFFIELAPLSSVEGMIPALSEALGCPIQSGQRSPKQSILDELRHKNVLLVMDNFEHVIEGAAFIDEILAAAPDVKILVTSRERLNLQGEALFRLEGFAFPDWQSPDEASEYSAVKLFVQSAQYVQPGFALRG